MEIVNGTQKNQREKVFMANRKSMVAVKVTQKKLTLYRGTKRIFRVYINIFYFHISSRKMPSFFIIALDEPTYKELNNKLEKWWPQNMIHNNDNDNESSCQSVKLSVCQ